MFKSVHLKALFVWIVYSVITKASFLAGSIKTEVMSAFSLNVFLSVFFGILFLYFFSHEDFFKFAKEIENKNIKSERRWEHRFLHYGKLTSAILIGVATGPLIGALAARFLLVKFKYKYLTVSLSSALGSIFWLGVARGIIRI
ncbi:MAG: hypothetical protein UT17_C0001G0078 [Candidatus Woesebacteria bacterium GW2011_GWB1_39_10]|uniref:Uncharacterized protein n=2 Tax=Candidatus Woeseibacteriota TaxID=1752722 RepID=A0A0G0UU31_9BACT|nr:MAG: hypothetical protein UT17_C0001G0078 [Candidatus Woesebacteria bacterium GW2011_GWB1_39_10]KKR92264.1 MAG: hypothetical protein UU42_C0002G0078 [Candidatus Woesebacteria bacterium GW2011_GWA1_41_13b]